MFYWYVSENNNDSGKSQIDDDGSEILSKPIPAVDPSAEEDVKTESGKPWKVTWNLERPGLGLKKSFLGPSFIFEPLKENLKDFQMHLRHTFYDVFWNKGSCFKNMWEPRGKTI